MNAFRRKSWRTTLLFVAMFAFAGCYGEGDPLRDHSSEKPDRLDASITATDAGTPHSDASARETPVIGSCTPADATKEPVPARTELLTNAVPKPVPAFVTDLFAKFNRACGDCHVNGTQGNPPFHVSPKTFSDDMPDEVLVRIFSNDPAKVMPPASGAASSRDPKSDPYLGLGTLLKAWYQQGKPGDFYFPPTAAGGPAFQMSKTVGLALTNLGNCIPSKDLVGVRVDAMDAFFESAVALPPRLEQTDLTTFDSEVLAQTRVIAFAPAYPLWADNARKIRYVRVPFGQSIRFDKSTQQFDIPDNTRFYKTFLKRTVARDGSVGYRKVETRVIVVRHPVPGPNGQDVQTALFGTYNWSPDEREAVLVDDRYHNGKPFVDVLRTLVVDEGKSDAITAGHVATSGNTLTHELVQGGATRTYAIPGSDRCMQCHMGSASRSFVLGFTPVQINRRKLGVGGIIEDPSRDDLTQLKRLIDYGIITGVTNADDILPLEDSEGTRKPRNNYELIAQGYMMGNCAHCHNPRGFPSVQNPDTLAHFLSFMPGTGPIDGIFQFPLEKFSPRIFRDLGGAVEMPYITPSMVDFPGQADFNHQVSHLQGTGTGPNLATDMVLAPWRSLIYRNVDTPFPYSNDQALFPHMPMNTPGFDCRVPRIMAEWMLSIPAIRKATPGAVRNPDGTIRHFYFVQENLVQGVDPLAGGVHDNTGTEQEPQPYKEVHPGDADYAAGAAAAQDRLDAYHGEGKYEITDAGVGAHVSSEGRDWPRYQYCPDTTDIVDPSVTGADRSHLVPSDLLYEVAGNKQYRIPVDYQPSGVANGTYDENLTLVPDDAVVSWPDDGVPDRPHWVVTDTTDSPGPWTPRRNDWRDTLVDHKTCPPPAGNKDAKLADMCAVVEMLSPKDPSEPGVTLSQAVRDYALNLIPYGLWKSQPGCAEQFASVKKVKDFDQSRPKWMDVAQADPSAPVYSVYPGAAVYNMVCINCHGPNADSHGRQADTLQIMTGGSARVANFRDGLFGPLSSPDSNRKREFAAGGNATPDDWAARYVSWMALGGTQKLIPKSILDVVVRTPVFGVSRQLAGVDSANMLGPIQTLCSEFFGLPFHARDSAANNGVGGGFVRPSLDSTTVRRDDKLWELTVHGTARGAFLVDNGDAELFGRLCTLDNPMPVAAIQADDQGQWTVLYFPASAYGAAPAGNDRGAVDDGGVLPENVMPWCVHPASTGTVPTADGKPAPICPPALLGSAEMTWDALRAWSFRGAINAGLSAFLYIDKVENGYSPVPGHDHCEQLK